MTDENQDDRDHRLHGSTDSRTTAPQSEYAAKQIAVGTVIAIVGLAITFGVPLAVLY